MPDLLAGEDVQPSVALRKVTRLSEEPRVSLSAISGNSHDQGATTTLIARYVNGAEEFDLGLCEMEPQEYHPRHFHPEGAEFYYILDGSCLITIDDEDVEARPGTAFYMPPGTVHAVRTREGERVKLIFGFSKGDFRECGTTWLE
jgi:quercetin dioxygenase-like cupin family protein